LGKLNSIHIVCSKKEREDMYMEAANTNKLKNIDVSKILRLEEELSYQKGYY
jgi:hypothetical protein